MGYYGLIQILKRRGPRTPDRRPTSASRDAKKKETRRTEISTFVLLEYTRFDG